MKTSALLGYVFCLSICSCLAADTQKEGVPSSAQIDPKLVQRTSAVNFNNRLVSGDPTLLDDLKALPISVAERKLIGEVMSRKENGERGERALHLMLQLPGIWDYYAEMIKDDVTNHHGFHVDSIFSRVAASGTDDCIKLIGPYLFSSVKPMDYAVPGFHFPTVSVAAMSALHSLDLPDSPTKGQASLRGSNDVRRWQEWWKENAHRYYENVVPPDPPTAPQPPPPAAPEIPAPPQPPASLPDTLTPLLLNAGPPPPNWHPLAIAVALLLAIGFYYQFRRRNER